MLETIITFLAIAGLCNCSLFILSLKWKIWVRLRIRECAFCTFFWLTLIEVPFLFSKDLMLSPSGLLAIPVALAGATAGVIFLSFYGSRDFQ